MRMYKAIVSFTAEEHGQVVAFSDGLQEFIDDVTCVNCVGQEVLRVVERPQTSEIEEK